MRFLMLLALLAGLSTPALADWAVDPAKSVVYYTSVKNRSVAENNRFTVVKGVLAEAGALDIRIDLASVDTGIAIRDERLRKLLFQVDAHPEARITASIDMGVLEAWDGPLALEVPFALSLHGLEANYKVGITLFRLDADTVLVSSREPVLVDAKDFNLLDGIEQLRALAGLSEITPVVPVGFSLTLRAD